MLELIGAGVSITGAGAGVSTTGVSTTTGAGAGVSTTTGVSTGAGTSATVTSDWVFFGMRLTSVFVPRLELLPALPTELLV